jgi:hypothetical protein
MAFICDKFKNYLFGNTFRVLTDNNPLTYVLTTANLDATGHRWLAAVGAFNDIGRVRLLDLFHLHLYIVQMVIYNLGIL